MDLTGPTARLSKLGIRVCAVKTKWTRRRARGGKTSPGVRRRQAACPTAPATPAMPPKHVRVGSHSHQHRASDKPDWLVFAATWSHAPFKSHCIRDHLLTRIQWQWHAVEAQQPQCSPTSYTRFQVWTTSLDHLPRNSASRSSCPILRGNEMLSGNFPATGLQATTRKDFALTQNIQCPHHSVRQTGTRRSARRPSARHIITRPQSKPGAPLRFTGIRPDPPE